MAGNKVSSKQIVSKDVLEQLYKESDYFASDTDNIELDDLLRSLNNEATPPLKMFETATPDLVLNIDNIVVTNPETDVRRTVPPISNLAPAFTSGTVTFPASSGGNATPSAGDAIVITVSSGNFLKVGINLTSAGNILLQAGVEGASEAAATVPALIPGTFPIGYVVLENVGGVIQNIENDRIVQFVGGGGGSGSGSGSGEINYIDNADAEVGTTGWVTYADAAGVTPVDGTGGSPNITWASQSATALRGGASFKLSKDAADRQGEGVSYDFEIKAQDISKKLKIQFDFKTDEDAAYVLDDVSIYIYDVTNGLLITPVDTGIVSGQNIWQTSFNATSSLSYRLIIHIASTNSSAYDLYFDNFIVGPGMVSQGAVIGRWEAYTPTVGTISGFTYGPTGFYRRVGDSMDILVFWRKNGSAGTGGSVVNISIPPGFTIDATRINGLSNVGNIGFAEHIQSGYQALRTVNYINDTNFAIGLASSQMIGTDFGATSYTEIRCLSLPIAEWAGKGVVPMLAEDNLNEWTAFTPVWAGLVNTSSNVGYWRRVGDSVEISTKAVLSGVVTGNILLTLPNSLVADSTKTATSDTIVGSAWAFDATATARYVSAAILSNTTQINISEEGGGTGQWDANAPVTWASGDLLSVKAMVPVTAFAGSQNSLVGFSDATTTQNGLVKALKTYTGADVSISSTPAGWSLTAAFFTPYQTVDGQWWLRFSIQASTTAVASTSIVINGVTFSSLQPIATIPPNTSTVGYAFCNNGGGTIFRQLGATYATFAVSGEVAITGKPTWAD